MRDRNYFDGNIKTKTSILYTALTLKRRCLQTGKSL